MDVGIWSLDDLPTWAQGPLWRSPPNAWHRVMFRGENSPCLTSPQTSGATWEFLQHQPFRCSAKLRRPRHGSQRGDSPPTSEALRDFLANSAALPCRSPMWHSTESAGYGGDGWNENEVHTMFFHCFPFIGVKIGCTPSNYAKNMSWLTL